MGRRTLPAGALPGTTAAPAPAPAPAPGTPRAEPGPSDSPADGTAPGSRALRFVSRHGPADTDAFRKDGPLTPEGHRHATRYTAVDQEKSTGTTPSPLHVVDFGLPARP